MTRQTKKVSRLSRRDLEKLAADLVQRIKVHSDKLAAIKHTHAPDEKQSDASRS